MFLIHGSQSGTGYFIGGFQSRDQDDVRISGGGQEVKTNTTNTALENTDMEKSSYCKDLEPVARQKYEQLVDKYIGRDPDLIENERIFNRSKRFADNQGRGDHELFSSSDIVLHQTTDEGKVQKFGGIELFLSVDGSSTLVQNA
ncbi:hypothetical protein NL108_006162 [Boleophthalmus pectinirostris]|nr:hypothetical protein NL108_006162 [Boleophthalmus pectinirostris]